MTLTRADLLANGFVYMNGGIGCYLHPSGLNVMIPTYPEYDDHVREPWWWDFGEPYTRIPQRLCPVTVGGLHRLIELTERAGQ